MSTPASTRPDAPLPAVLVAPGPGDLVPLVLAPGTQPATTPHPPRISEEEAETIRRTALAADAENTKRAYRTAWTSFVSFCKARGATPLPALPETIAVYLTLATRIDGRPYTLGTLNLHLAAIKRAHREWNLTPATEHPLVYRVLRGLRRQRGAHQVAAPALTADLLRKAVDALPDGETAQDMGNLRNVRNRALLLVGFAGAFRRSELAALTFADVSVQPWGVRLRIVRRKTDPDKDAFIDLDARVGAPQYNPALALIAWIEFLAASHARIALDTSLWLRLTPETIRNIVKAAAKAAGLGDKFSAHSLRSGYATTAAELGASVVDIREAGGWKSVVTVDRYIQHRRQVGPDAPRSAVLAAISAAG